MKLEGLIVPLITPLNPDETLDEPGLERVVEYVIAGGVNGIFILGSSGEFPGLSDSTKERLVRAVRAQIGQRDVSLLVGCARAGTRHSLEESRRLGALGADAIVITAPYYFRYSQSELMTHFLTVARGLDVPTVVYNIPQMVKMTLEPETVAQLAAEPAIIGIKDSAGDMDRFRQILELRSKYPEFRVCQGAETCVVESVLAGADGLVLGLANIAPRICREIFDTARHGDAATAQTLNEQLMMLYPINEFKSFLAGLKTAAHLLGLCQPDVTMPFQPLNQDQVERVGEILAAVNLR